MKMELMVYVTICHQKIDKDRLDILPETNFML